MVCSQTEYDQLVWNEVIVNGSLSQYFTVRCFNKLGNSSSKSFNLRKYGTKEIAYDYAIKFHKTVYPFYDRSCDCKSEYT